MRLSLTLVLVSGMVAIASACGGAGDRERADTRVASDAGTPPVTGAARIAFTRSVSSGAGIADDIYVTRVRSGRPAALTSTPELDEAWPAWSPDGRRIVFAASRDSRHASIYVKDVGSASAENLSATSGVGGGDPTWSADGRRIAFVGGEVGSDILVISADGSGVANVTDTADATESEPSWSSLEPRIAFVRAHRRPAGRSAGRTAIRAIDLDGGNEANLTSAASLAGVIPSSPSYSPDGSRIVFLGLRQGARTPAVWTTDADGDHPMRLTGARAAPYSAPAFSPDGSRIAFAGSGEDGHGIYVLDADGGGGFKLAGTGPNDRDPAWSSVP